MSNAHNSQSAVSAARSRKHATNLYLSESAKTKLELLSHRAGVSQSVFVEQYIHRAAKNIGGTHGSENYPC